MGTELLCGSDIYDTKTERRVRVTYDNHFSCSEIGKVPESATTTSVLAVVNALVIMSAASLWTLFNFFTIYYFSRASPQHWTPFSRLRTTAPSYTLFSTALLRPYLAAMLLLNAINNFLVFLTHLLTWAPKVSFLFKVMPSNSDYQKSLPPYLPNLGHSLPGLGLGGTCRLFQCFGPVKT